MLFGVLMVLAKFEGVAAFAAGVGNAELLLTDLLLGAACFLAAFCPPFDGVCAEGDNVVCKAGLDVTT